MEMLTYHEENIKDLALKTMWYAEDFYESLSAELDARLDRKTFNEQILFAYHSTAYSTFMGFKLYYLQNTELSESKFDRFIEAFERFNLEFLSSRSTGHSMQHTFMYYGDLVDTFNDLADLLQIQHIKKPD
ncbi:hypothetical protein [Lysinibacillus sp. LZ02]|uniref:hypothetical protein n=1 Tax=Lysinibacillus sp. LZ02 TaxID=3420668 RepID=UPI003D36777A